MEWTEDLAVGVATIDKQHQELFKRINNLVSAIKQHRCKEEIDSTISFLADYARFHFAEEEKRMDRAQYDGLGDHQEQHRHYLASIAELKQQASLPRAPGASYELSVTVNQVVVDWIVDHIMKTDKKLGLFLKGGGN